MIEALIERAVQTALCRAVEQSFREAGLPSGVVREMGSRLLTPTPVDEERADAAAAAALDAEDEEDLIPRPAEQSLPSETQIAAMAEKGGRPGTPTVDELMSWMVPTLEDGGTWADIARATGQGHDLDEEALCGPDRP